MSGLRVAVVGLGFGAAFPPIYRDHPDVSAVGVCDSRPGLAASYAAEHGLDAAHTSINDVLTSDSYDAVHLLTPIPDHAAHTLAVLQSGKHCACTVPMATTLSDLEEIVAEERRTGLVYMMMETAVYTHHSLYVQKLHREGAFGRLQFLRGAHYQDMAGWPDYWLGLPPMHYATHAIAPLLAIADTRATSVRALGSGSMPDRLVARYGNPYPVETASFALENHYPLALEVTRSLFATSRSYVESFSVLGEQHSFEWHLEHELPLLFTMQESGAGRGSEITYERVTPPDTADLLPPEIRHHSAHQLVADPENPHQSLLQGAGHHGSHPHLVHEFVRSIVEGRRSRISSTEGARWTAPGLCAHESAMRGGEEIAVPDYA